jgi:H+/gluconate symporter-like permease
MIEKSLGHDLWTPMLLLFRISVANIIFSKQEKLLDKTKSILNFKGAAAGLRIS